MESDSHLEKVQDVAFKELLVSLQAENSNP